MTNDLENANADTLSVSVLMKDTDLVDQISENDSSLSRNTSCVNSNEEDMNQLTSSESGSVTGLIVTTESLLGISRPPYVHKGSMSHHKSAPRSNFR